MKILIVAVMLSFALLVPSVVSPAYAAQVVEWQADDPKQGRDLFIRCTGEATAGGVTYRNHNWTLREGGREVGVCKASAVHDVKSFFKYNHVSVSPVLTESIDIVGNDVQVSVGK